MDVCDDNCMIATAGGGNDDVVCASLASKRRDGVMALAILHNKNTTTSRCANADVPMTDNDRTIKWITKKIFFFKFQVHWSVV